MWVEKEYYFDSRKELRQKSDYDYVNDFIRFIDGYHVKATYVDPSAASLKQEFMRNGVRGIADAENDVLAGIRFLGQLLTNGSLKICRDCPNLIKEFSTYAWDPKASARGEDKPLKANDHALDGLKYCLFSHFFHKTQNSMSREDVLALERRNKWY
jgi:phage terminase large subunit